MRIIIIVGKLNGNSIFDDFETYLDSQKYTYHSVAEQQVNHILTEIKSDRAEKNIMENLERIKSEFLKLGNSELKIYKDEIITEIKIELADRYIGNKGRIEEELKYDNQFQTALNILNNQKVYDKLLNL